MLINCPECDQKVSDRAPACPGCGFPIAEETAAERAKEQLAAQRATRREIGEVDCPACEARGFVMEDFTDHTGDTRQGFRWCQSCERTGRLHLVQSDEGFFAVTRTAIAGFLAGEHDADDARAWNLGPQAPADHRYPEAGKRHGGK